MTYLLAFICGALASHWIETLIARQLLLHIKDKEVNTAVRKYVTAHGIQPTAKGKIISMASIDAQKAFTKGGNLEEMLDYAGSEVQEE